MRNRMTLILMEVLVMLLVFSLAAALCLRAFVEADRISGETDMEIRAALLCQNGAQALKIWKDPVLAAEQIQSDDDIRLEIQMLDSGVPGLGKARVCAVETATDRVLYSLTVGWQEVAP